MDFEADLKADVWPREDRREPGVLGKSMVVAFTLSLESPSPCRFSDRAAEPVPNFEGQLYRRSAGLILAWNSGGSELSSIRMTEMWDTDCGA